MINRLGKTKVNSSTFQRCWNNQTSIHTLSWRMDQMLFHYRRYSQLEVTTIKKYGEEKLPHIFCLIIALM
mgnify:CR=1 FL=1|jgi:hypothetical protein